MRQHTADSWPSAGAQSEACRGHYTVSETVSLSFVFLEKKSRFSFTCFLSRLIPGAAGIPTAPGNGVIFGNSAGQDFSFVSH